MIKTIGFWLARLILLGTGNAEVAVILKSLPRVAALPLRLEAQDNGYRIRYPSGPSEWDQWQCHGTTLDCPQK